MPNMIMTRKLALAALCAVAVLPFSPALAQQAAEVQISYSSGQFQPSEIRAPADRPIALRVRNMDGKAMELDIRHTAIWEKRGGKWLIVHEHVSAPLQ